MHPSTSRRQPAMALCFALLFVAAPAAAEEDMSGWPDWLRSAMLEESKSDRTKKLKFSDNASVRLLGKPMESQVLDNGWYLPTDVGSGSPVECYILTNEPDLATTAIQLSDVNVQVVSDANGPVGNKSVYYLDAGEIDGVPYFAIDWMYTVGEESEAKAALTKVRVAVNGELVQACTHNGVGYRETLGKAFRAFVTSLDYPRTMPDPYYREVVRMSLGEQPIGLAWFSYTLDADGDTEIRYSDAQIVPVDAATVQSGDSSAVSFSYPDGTLINQVSAAVENGELVTRLALSRGAENEWIVSGTFQGKALEVTLDGAVAPLSNLGQQFSAQDLLAGDADRMTFDVWLPEADPSSFLAAVIERANDDSLHNVRLQLGPIAMDMEVDETGSAKSGSMQAGAATVTMDRIYVDGEVR
ncbi:MAG: hypothetical protein AAGE85_06490 [Pseudomonadota bacterium]